MAVRLPISPNKLCQEVQVIESSQNLLMMIGENGCGKSAILEKTFEEYLDNPEKQVVCFTSGMNESYSPIFNQFIRKNRRFLIESENEDINAAFNSFYFHGGWAKALIFFATALKRDGRVRQFLLEKRYCNVSGDGLNDDVSTTLNLSIRIDKWYIQTIQYALKREEDAPEFRSIRRTVFHRLFSNLAEQFIHREYDFERPQRRKWITLKANQIFDLFSSAKEKEIFTFLSLATKDNRFINQSNWELNLKGRKVQDLSDGEFQLLTVNAMLDLFDSPDTIFLFDEIDSHLHYQNVKKLWQNLRGVQGMVLTTTHSADSIVCNSPEVIKLVNQGKIEENTTPVEIFKRLEALSENDTYSYQMMAKLPFIALVENKFDWFVFREVCKIKVGVDEAAVLDKVSAIPCSSGHNTKDERFGMAKIRWAKKLFEICPESKTNCHVFMICDKDNYPISNISRNAGNFEVTARTDKDYLIEELGPQNTHRAILLSWKRREIENYLLSETMLSQNGKINDVKNLIAPMYQESLKNGSNVGLAEIDVKSILKNLYLKDGYTDLGTHEEGVDYEKLKNVIAQIPAREISDDISAMFNFLRSKIQPQNTQNG